jgi:hypothetical protein
VRPVAAFLLCLAVAGCAAISAAPTSTPSATANPQAADHQGSFNLAFELPRTTWKAGEAIDGAATLSVTKARGVDLGGSGSGLIGFDFAELNGSRHVQPAQTSDCRPYRLDPGAAISSPISKSGGFYPEQPDFEFYRSFLTDPMVHLPAGEWTITAVATFSEGQGCSGQFRTMRAGVRIRITP